MSPLTASDVLRAAEFSFVFNTGRTYSRVVYLPPSLYDAAEAEGYDMRYYAKTELIPDAD